MSAALTFARMPILPLDPTVVRRVPLGATMMFASGTVAQFGGAVAVVLLRTVGPTGGATLRFSVAALVFVAVGRPSIRSRSHETLLLATALGATLLVMILAFYTAVARLPLSYVVTLQVTGPLVVAGVLSHRKRDLVWVALAGLGVVLLHEGGFQALDPVGICCALLAGASWGTYIVLGRRTVKAFSGRDGLTIATCVAAMVILPIGVVADGSTLLNPKVLVLGVSVGLLSSVIPWSLEQVALRRLSALTFGVLLSFSPALAALAGFVVLGQTLTPWQIGALAVVVVAGFGVTRLETEDQLGDEALERSSVRLRARESQ